MELTKIVKDLLKAHEMACVSDFISEQEVEVYLENTDLDLSEIGVLCETYKGFGVFDLEGKIINELRKYL
jgi:hypothetical protein